MKIIHGSENFDASLSSPVLTIGNFDGVHLGHQAIFEQIVKRAKKIGGASVVYTFDPHPAKLVAPDVGLKLLQTTEQKISAISKCGVDVCIIEPFTKEFAHLEPQVFFNNIIFKRINPRRVVVGYDLTFGRHRQGTISLLRELCSRHEIVVDVVSEILLDETIISSTQIRNFIGTGHVDIAMQMLSRPFVVAGEVIHGRGLGNKLGFHTANLKVENEIVPKVGVYITKTLSHRSVTNIGFNPTFGGTEKTFETHILGFSKDIYGKKIDVEFFKRLRDERTFETPEALAKQIDKDIREANKYFEGASKNSLTCHCEET